MTSARYIGDECGRVTIGAHAIDVGEVVTGPESVVLDLLLRGDFIAVGMVGDLEAEIKSTKKPKAAKGKEP
jgi:hypothetical protein